MKQKEIIELTGMAFGGDALGRLPDGRPVFVPFGYVGECVLVEYQDEGQTYCRGKIVEIQTPSPQRITPRCPHFGECGGCHYQFLPYPIQVDVKQQIIADQFRRIGRFENAPIQPMIPSPLEWNYRNIVQFSVSSDGKPGYQRSASNQVIAIHECSLPTEGINQIWPELDLDPEAGLRRVILREGIDGDILLTLEGEGVEVPEFGVDFPISAVYRGEGNEVLLSGDPFTYIQVKDKGFRVSAGSFFQVNLPQAERMVDLVLDSLAMHPGETVLDCYCGVGLFSKFLATQAGKLIGIEISESACDDYAENLAEYDNVELYIGSAQQILPGLQTHVDHVIVDPPRAGIEKQALDALAALQPNNLVYVSCDPATLARDARRLVEKGYELVSVTPLDLFPQTYHIESVTLFTRISA